MPSRSAAIAIACLVVFQMGIGPAARGSAARPDALRVTCDATRPVPLTPCHRHGGLPALERIAGSIRK